MALGNSQRWNWSPYGEISLSNSQYDNKQAGFYKLVVTYDHDRFTVNLGHSSIHFLAWLILTVTVFSLSALIKAHFALPSQTADLTPGLETIHIWFSNLKRPGHIWSECPVISSSARNNVFSSVNQEREQGRGRQEWDKHVILLAQRVSQRHHQSESSHFNMLLWWAGGGGGAGLPGDNKHIHTHTHTQKPSPLISLIYYDMWLAASSILQICTLTGSRMPNFCALRLFLPLYTCSPHHTDTNIHKHNHSLRFFFAWIKAITLTYARVLSHIFDVHMWPCATS